MDPVTLSNMSFWLNMLLIGMIGGVLTRDLFDDRRRALVAFLLFAFLVVTPISWARSTVNDALTKAQEPAESTQTTSTTEETRRLDEQSINKMMLTHSGITFRL